MGSYPDLLEAVLGFLPKSHHYGRLFRSLGRGPGEWQPEGKLSKAWDSGQPPWLAMPQVQFWVWLEAAFQSPHKQHYTGVSTRQFCSIILPTPCHFLGQTSESIEDVWGHSSSQLPSTDVAVTMGCLCPILKLWISHGNPLKFRERFFPYLRAALPWNWKVGSNWTLVKG